MQQGNNRVGFDFSGWQLMRCVEHWSNSYKVIPFEEQKFQGFTCLM